MLNPRRRSPLRALLLCLVLLLPGTPQIVSADQASAALSRLAAVAQDTFSAEDEPGRVGGAPPGLDEMRTLSQSPPLSGANPPYPRNHVLDANLQTVGTPPANHDFETPGYQVGTPPTNHDLEAAVQVVGTPPTNHDFETGDLSGWTPANTVTIESDTPHGSYAKLSGTNAEIVSDAFTVDSAAQVFAVDLGWLTANYYSWVKIFVLSGTGYATSTEIASLYCYQCGYWERHTVDASAWLGQSIKLKFWRYYGDVGIDDLQVEATFPGYTVSGPVVRAEEAGNSSAQLTDSGASLTSAAFTVESSAQYGALDVTGLSALSDQYYAYVLSGPGYSTQTQVVVGSSTPDSWQTVRFHLGPWLGQSIKLKVAQQYAQVGIDNLGVQWLDLPNWQVTGDTWIAEEAGNRYVSTNGTLTSAPFTLPSDIQQLVIPYRDVDNDGIFDITLLGGVDYSQELFSVHVGALDGGWQAQRVGVQDYAGQSVKLVLDRYWGRLEFDDVGVGEHVLPGWQASGTHPMTVGEDEQGSYVTPLDSAITLESSPIATGIIDRTTASDLRFYSVSYAFGDGVGSLFRVWWTDAATEQSWVVHQEASNVATEPQTAYFYVAEFMGEAGYFTVQVPRAGKLYSLADNIARQQLSEPFSETVGYHIDTSTGSFGYQETDIQTAGTLPLVFTRYYAGHSDHYGAMGYRWTHTYDIRLVLTDDDDAGVVYGSGREVFFDGTGSSYAPADARVHDDLVKNGDGSYTYTTTTNLAYDFDAGGVLQSISDLNGNQITLGYNGSGQLTTITGLGSQVITLGYDGTGRISTVTDPESQVWTYGYDANGDLTTVTAPDLGVRQYVYDRHRLTKAINPLGDVLFENVFDDWHRVTQQKDADLNTLTIAYDTPGAGATQVTDPEQNTATYYFDHYQRTTHMVDPLGHTIQRTFDTNGNLIRVIDPALDQWDFAYSTGGDVTLLQDPLGNDVEVSYNTEHLPTTITDARGNVTTLAYDTNGNVTSRTDPLNHTWTYTYDSAGNVLTETDPLNHTTTYTYDAAGNVLTKTDALNHTWTYTYDFSGRLLTETDPLNHTTTYTYDVFGRPKTVTDALGEVLSYDYSVFYREAYRRVNKRGYESTRTLDDLGRITSVIDEAGKVTSYGYDANSNITTVTNPLNHTTTYAYDENNRVISQTDPLNHTTSWTYDAQGRLASETDPLNQTTTYAYDDAGRLTSRTLPNNGVWSYTYDADGNLLTETDPLDQVTGYSYDANSNMVSMTDARNNVWTYTYDPLGRLLTETNPLNETWTYTYDAVGNLISVTNPLNQTTTFSYDAAGRRTGTTDALNHTWTYAYDAVGNLISETDPLGNTTNYSYDEEGNRTQVTLPSLSVTSYVYDPRGLLTSITDPLSYVTSYSYDAAGQRSGVTDRRNNTTSYAYDAAGRMTSMTDALSGVVTFGYDAAGQLTSLTDPNSNTRNYTYDALGNILTETDPLNRTTTYSYDLMGQVTGRTDPRSVAVTFGYDANGNQTSISYAGGSITNSYDAANRRTSMLDGTGTTTWTYDANGHVTSVAAPNGTSSFTYDATGHRATMTLPGSRTLTYAYDVAGRVTSLTDWLSQAISFGYDVDGNRTTITRPNGVTSSYTYDAAGQVMAIDHSGAGCLCSLQSYSYTYDAEGNRTSVTTEAGTENYTLDALNRLTAVTYSNGDTEAFTYDAAGNRLTHAVNTQQVASYTYDAAGQLLSDGTITYSHDAAGNLTAAGADSFTWDWANRLTSATVSGMTESYTYDGDGVRVSATVNSLTTTYVWDRLGDVELLIDDGANAYLHLGGLLAEIDGSNTTSYVLSDGLGSVRGLTDANEQLVGTADFAVFGEARSQTGATSRFGFTGEQTDAVTDNVYLRARYLNPALGRFLSSDAVQPNAPGSQGYNRYSYVANNPATWTDPTGHETQYARTLHPQWYLIAATIAAFFVAQACAGVVAVGCGNALFVMASFVIIVLVMMVCALGGFDWACYINIPIPSGGISRWWEDDPPSLFGPLPWLWYLVISIPEVAFGPPGDRGGSGDGDNRGRPGRPDFEHRPWKQIKEAGRRWGKCFILDGFIYFLDEAHQSPHMEVWREKGRRRYEGIADAERGGQLINPESEQNRRRQRQGRDAKKTCGK